MNRGLRGQGAGAWSPQRDVVRELCKSGPKVVTFALRVAEGGNITALDLISSLYSMLQRVHYGLAIMPEDVLKHTYLTLRKPSEALLKDWETFHVFEEQQMHALTHYRNSQHSLLCTRARHDVWDVEKMFGFSKCPSSKTSKGINPDSAGCNGKTKS
eukprot:1161516-Pelagomonas_calceolata.AAC.10